MSSDWKFDKGSYKGNPALKGRGEQHEFTPDQVKEFIKCSQDPEYFLTNYIKVISLDDGIIPFHPYPFQQKLVNSFNENRFTICKLPRQSGKSVVTTAYLIHQALFRDNINIAILANKRDTAFELMAKLQTSYENLPKWLQQGVVQWNKGSIELENGSRITASSTSSSAVRGFSYNIVFLDEFAFVPTTLADEFFASVYPTISSGKSTKVIIVSTPNGMNHFYRMWHDAEKGKNSYNPISAHWSEVPGRDEKWREETIANTSLQQFQQEFDCDFIGSAGTLIAPSKLKNLAFDSPLESSGGLDIYERPQKGHEYLMTVDVSRGMKMDYSAFLIVDISQYPHKVVGKYRNNNIKPMLYPDIIVQVAKQYNNAWILCEVNDIGDQVASIIFYDMEYENLLMTSMRGRAGQVLGHGFSGGKTQLGLKMAKAPKKIGCSNLKQLVESDKVFINDFHIINELTTFIEKRSSFEAEDGCHDDLVMCMVIYAWAVAQDYFKEMTDQSIRKELYEKDKDSLEEDMSPFGFISDGVNDEARFVEDGNIWTKVTNEVYDEYGTTMGNWEWGGNHHGW
ncbi:terminase large subunit [Synechococcus phage S-B68]|nr:terminase large subunit [Synechococcus phage S-B68]